MATYQILYWQEIPSQIKVIEGIDELAVPLDPRFMAEIDRMASERGCDGEDAYLEGWNWGDPIKKEGTLQEVADAVQEELDKQFTF